MTLETAVKERPILFSGAMVRAILDGRKSQTRRVVKPQPSAEFMPEVGWYHPTKVDRDGEMYPGDLQFGVSDENEDVKCPFGAPGDRLWVREAWRTREVFDDLTPKEVGKRVGKDVLYLADGTIADLSGVTDPFIPGRYRHARFMPRWASRITLEVTGVRVERLQEISHKDAMAEGWPDQNRSRYPNGPHSDVTEADYINAGPDGCIMDDECIDWYSGLWESINGPGSWDANPFCWVIEFKQLEKGTTK